MIKQLKKKCLIGMLMGVIMLAINTYDFIEEIIKSVEKRYEILDKKMGLALIMWTDLNVN